MLKDKKILIIAVSVLAAVIVFGGGVALLTSGDGETTTAQVSTTFPDESTSASDAASLDSTALSTTGASDTTGYVSDTTAAPTEDLATALVGTWSDSAGMSGFKFGEDGSVEVTYVNMTVPVVNLPINGTAMGVYTVSGNTVTVKFSIYTATIDRTYEASIDGNTLTMYDLEERETATYTKKSDVPPATDTSVSSEPAEEFLSGISGMWSNSDASVKYNFSSDGTVEIILNNAVYDNIGQSPVTNTVRGIYISTDSEITMQYTTEKGKVTEKFTYSIQGNVLSLTNDEGDIELFVRQGSQAQSTVSESQLYGTWRDGTDMSGYEFMQGGVVNITYVNFKVPVINMPITGTYKGSYSLSNNELTVSYSAYGKNITETYNVSVSQNSLVISDISTGSVKTYIKQ